MPPRYNYTAPPGFRFPRLSGIALTLVAANVAVTFLFYLTQSSGLLLPLVLKPAEVLHGKLWQLATYSFLDLFGVLSLLFSSLALWTFGAMLESAWGKRRFAELYFG